MTTTVHDGRRDRAALVAVAVQFWINGMVYSAIVPRLPDIRDRLSVGVATLGLILTIAAVGGLVGSAIGGPAIVRYGTKRCIIVGTVLTLLVLPAVGLTTSAVVLTVVLAVLAVFDVVIDIAMNIQGSRLSSRRRTPVMNRLHGLWSLGTVVGGLLSVRAAGAEIPVAVHLSAVSVLLAAALAVFGRLLLPADGEATAGPAADAGPPRPGDERTGVDVTTAPILARRTGLLLAALGGAAVTMELTTSDWAAFRLADDLGVGPGRVGLGFVAFTAGMVTGRFAGDSIQAVIGRHSLVRAAATLAAAGLLVATVTPDRLTAALGVDPVVVAIAGFYLAALGVSVIFPQLYDAAARAPGPAGRGLGYLTAGTRIAGLASPVVVGVVAGTDLSVGTAVALITVPCCAIAFFGSSAAQPGPG